MFDTKIHELSRAVTRLQGASFDVLHCIGELDQAKVWHGTGYGSMTRWLCAQHDITFATAREWVRVGRALRALPAVSKAFRDGFLTFDQIRPLTLLASADTDEEWAGVAEGMRPAELWERWRHELEIERHEERELHRWRYLSIDWNEEKTECYGAFRLGAEQGAKLERALRRRASRVDPGDAHDPAAAAMADALVGLVTETKTGSSQPLLVVHTNVDTLAGNGDGGFGLAETSSGARLSTEAVRQLAREAKIEWVLEHEGRCVGVGFQSKHPPVWLTRRLEERDRTCRFPGCGSHRFLKAHHIRHWPYGPTDLGNLVLLCAFHHNLVHKGGWRIRGHPEADLAFVDPRGRVRVSVPRRRLVYAAARADDELASVAG